MKYGFSVGAFLLGGATIWLVSRYLPKKVDQQELKDQVLRGKTVMCATHTGNGLMLWSNGEVHCYQCGKEKLR